MNERFKKNAETNFKIMENFINDHDPMGYVNCYVLFEVLDSLKPVTDQINTKHIVNGDIVSYFERHTLSTEGVVLKWQHVISQILAVDTIVPISMVQEQLQRIADFKQRWLDVLFLVGDVEQYGYKVKPLNYQSLALIVSTLKELV